jgi:multidrug efflux pump subunit AcrA (membrane-fusion protein)
MATAARDLSRALSGAMKPSAASSHRLRDLRRPPWIAAAAGIVVLGSAMLSLGSVGSSANESYTLVRRGDVTAEVSAAGTIQSADTRQLAFGSTGTVTAVDVKIGQSVSAGQILARLDDTSAKEQVAVAEAALTSANASYTQVEDGGSATTSGSAGSSGSTGSSGSSGSSTGCSSTGGSTTGASTVTVQAASFAKPQPRPRPHPSPTATSPRPSPSPTTPAPSPSVSTTPAPPSATPTIPPRPSHTPRPTPSRTGKPKPGHKHGKKPTGKKGKTGSKGAKKGGSKGGSKGCASSGNPLANASARVTQAEVAVRQAERALEGTEITAPMSGTVLALNGAVGDQIGGAAATGFVTLGDLEDLQVQAMFSLNDVNRLRIGQQATVTFGVQPDKQYTGTVTSIAPAATVNGNLALFGVNLSLDSRPPGLMVGMTAAAQVITAQTGGALYVPETAVRTAPNGKSTVLVKHDGHTVIRDVTTGVHGDRYVAITSGLSAGDQVDTSTDTSADTFPVSG